MLSLWQQGLPDLPLLKVAERLIDDVIVTDPGFKDLVESGPVFRGQVIFPVAKPPYAGA